MNKNLCIKKLKFKSGSAPGKTELEFECPNVTVLVGPNNSGKSQTLREIELICRGQNPVCTILDSIELEWPETYEELMALLKPQITDPPRNNTPEVGSFWIARPTIRQGEDEHHQKVNESNLAQWFKDKSRDPLFKIVVRTFTLRLDGKSRSDLMEAKPTGDLEGYPKNHLWALFVNDDNRERVRKFTDEAFNRQFVIDPTGMTQFRARLANRKPKSKSEEQSLDAEARSYHSSSPLVSDLGDGVRASIGLVAAVMSLPHRILLIDEPEAFLHPTLARRLGRELVGIAQERNASLIVATHSSDYLLGSIQAAPNGLRIVRLTYAGNISTARSIEPDKVIELMQDPLLRSSNALRGLFHSGVVVSESDADRAFYEEINYRLTQDKKGIADALFMNGQNWQTIPRIVLPLREIGIPAGAVFDLDVIMDSDFKCIWPIMHLSPDVRTKFEQDRNAIAQYMKTKGRELCKTRGISCFDDSEKELMINFINEAKKYGVFFVPVGELECWLSYLGVTHSKNNKPKWLTNIFSRLGSDPSDQAYVKAGNDDVWQFIQDIQKWMDDSNRLGIPY